LKWTYVARTVPREVAVTVGEWRRPPRAGDLVVARVAELGVHRHAESRAGRRMRLHVGDRIIGALGNRYATDFYEGYMVDHRCTHLLTAGGLIGTVVSAHEVRGRPTQLEIIGGLRDPGGAPLSTEGFATVLPAPAATHPPTVAVVGSGMNAGKTTTAGALLLGWTRAGLRAGAGKVTGSGSGKDRWEYVDAGAVAVADFLDFGMPSTFGYPRERLAATMLGIRDHLAAAGCEVIVLEIADGILMSETARLLERLGGEVEAVILATSDALSARAGVEILRGLDLPVRAVSGMVSRSPLAAREARAATGLPVLTVAELAAGGALRLLPAGAGTP
jgi:hypothetical protein